MNRGKFITFEGPEGAGKTTLISFLFRKFVNQVYSDAVLAIRDRLG